MTEDEAELFRRTAAEQDDPGAADRREAAAADRRAADLLAAVEGFDRLADGVFRAAMHAGGFRLHRRSDWRRERGES